MALPAETLQPSERTVLSVADLTRRIKRRIEDGLGYVWVSGEISNLRPAGPSGHLYFTLKDQESQIPCALWRMFVSRLRFRPEDGMEVLAYGRVDVYVPYGRYQFLVEQMEPRGVGALQIRFEQLKEKLAKEGLFDPARKRPLPRLPLKIALVTSPVGAAVQDMVRTIRTRCPVTQVYVYPVRVQGEGSAEEIAAAIGHLNLAMPDLDVLIVGRGGGSIEDLWAFNEEVVARAIFASRIPVISAVGHETDTTIADFVADVRALTPTDGAVKAVPRLDDVVGQLDDLDAKLRRALRARADLVRAALDGLRNGRAFGRLEELCVYLGQRLDELSERLDVAAGQAPYYLREHLEALAQTLAASVAQRPGLARRQADHLADLLRSHATRALEKARSAWREAAGRLEALSPLGILARGYSITRREPSGEVLRDARRLRPGDRILSILHDGRVVSRVEETRPPEGERVPRPPGEREVDTPNPPG
ncbi:MAG TPA: exodeoxyribonuclease VII large subunit [Planctomycetota bacterium]|nr:exodeoxyribonuclease VII large subunit [Planctomycetota bacterium]